MPVGVLLSDIFRDVPGLLRSVLGLPLVILTASIPFSSLLSWVGGGLDFFVGNSGKGLSAFSMVGDSGWTSGLRAAAV